MSFLGCDITHRFVQYRKKDIPFLRTFCPKIVLFSSLCSVRCPSVFIGHIYFIFPFVFSLFLASFPISQFLPILNFSLITWNIVILYKDPSENIGIYLIWSVLIQWLTKQNCMKFTFFFSSWNLKLVPVYLLEISYFTLFSSLLVRLQVQGIVIVLYEKRGGLWFYVLSGKLLKWTHWALYPTKKYFLDVSKKSLLSVYL